MSLFGILFFCFGMVFLLLGAFILVPSLIPARRNSLIYPEQPALTPAAIALSLILIIAGIFLAMVAVIPQEIQILLFCFGSLLLLLGSVTFLANTVIQTSRIRDSRTSQNSLLIPKLVSIIFLVSGLLMVIPSLVLKMWNPGNNNLSQNSFSSVNLTGQQSSSNIPTYKIKCIPGKDVLNVHKVPSLDSTTVVFSIPCNISNIKITGKSVEQDEEVWVPIKYQGNTGWVIRRFLERQ